MTDLRMDRAMPGGDAFYAALLAAHAGLSKAESDALNARLILILANLIADVATLEAAIAAAAADARPAADPGETPLRS